MSDENGGKGKISDAIFKSAIVISAIGVLLIIGFCMFGCGAKECQPVQVTIETRVAEPADDKDDAEGS